jgi:hypothetical protein
LLITQASSSASPCKKSIVVGRKAPNACAAWPRQFDGLGLPKPSSAVVSYFVRQAGLTLAFARSTASRLCRSTSYLQHSRTGMNKRPIPKADKAAARRDEHAGSAVWRHWHQGLCRQPQNGSPHSDVRERLSCFQHYPIPTELRSYWLTSPTKTLSDSDQDRLELNRSGQVRSGQVRSGQVRSGQARSLQVSRPA